MGKLVLLVITSLLIIGLSIMVSTYSIDQGLDYETEPDMIVSSEKLGRRRGDLPLNETYRHNEEDLEELGYGKEAGFKRFLKHKKLSRRNKEDDTNCTALHVLSNGNIIC